MKNLILSFGAMGLLAMGACAPMDQTPATPAPPEDGPSQCKADQHQAWIGRNRSELPTQPAGETWRVTCTTCPVTMDFNPNRLNILYDETSGVVREVKCG